MEHSGTLTYESSNILEIRAIIQVYFILFFLLLLCQQKRLQNNRLFTTSNNETKKKFEQLLPEDSWYELQHDPREYQRIRKWIDGWKIMKLFFERARIKKFRDHIFLIIPLYGIQVCVYSTLYAHSFFRPKILE